MTKLKLKDLIRELLSEIDWESPDIKDVKVQRCMSNEETVAWFNSELKRFDTSGTASASMPRITRGNMTEPIKKGRIKKGRIKIKSHIIDINQFIKLLTRTPKTIFDEGLKSVHTTDEDVMMINTGIPALRGFIYDADDSNTPFKVINTCPSAGKCVVDCYALQGFYIMNDGKNIKLAQRLQLIMTDPELYIEKGFIEALKFAQIANIDGKRLEIRWNDAGDFFSQRYYNCAVTITRRLLAKGLNIKSNFYTKMEGLVNIGEKEGMTVTFSQDNINSNIVTPKSSVIVPKHIFQPLDKSRRIFIATKGRGYETDPTTHKTKFKDGDVGRLELKNRIYDEYHTKSAFKLLTRESLRYTDELPKIEGTAGEFNVIILPSGDSDRPAQRRDVRYIFLLFH